MKCPLLFVTPLFSSIFDKEEEEEDHHQKKLFQIVNLELVN